MLVKGKAHKFVVLISLLSYLVYWILVPVHKAECNYHEDCKACLAGRQACHEAHADSQHYTNSHNHELHDPLHCSVCSSTANCVDAAGIFLYTLTLSILFQAIQSDDTQIIKLLYWPETIRGPPVITS